MDPYEAECAARQIQRAAEACGTKEETRHLLNAAEHLSTATQQVGKRLAAISKENAAREEHKWKRRHQKVYDECIREAARATAAEERADKAESALDTANRLLREHGLFGVLPSVGEDDEEEESRCEICGEHYYDPGGRTICLECDEGEPDE